MYSSSLPDPMHTRRSSIPALQSTSFFVSLCILLFPVFLLLLIPEDVEYIPLVCYSRCAPSHAVLRSERTLAVTGVQSCAISWSIGRTFSCRLFSFLFFLFGPNLSVQTQISPIFSFSFVVLDLVEQVELGSGSVCDYKVCTNCSSP